ncbi:MAG: NAD-dependent dehydratase, partial [Candidatus Altarchaeum sp. CG12_big_fil_rev_8_21_14_0_65_33_22]
LLNNKKVELRSHGLQIRDYLHVDDVAQGLICLLNEEKTSTYNIGSGNPVRVRDLVNHIGEILGKKKLI